MEFVKNPDREEHGRTYVPEKWKGPAGGCTLSEFFEVDEGARKPPTGKKIKLEKGQFSSQTSVYADGKLRTLSWEEDSEGFRTVEDELDYSTQCETVDVLPLVGDPKLMEAAIQMVEAAYEISSTSYHYESMEGTYELFDGLEAGWLRQQPQPGRCWTRMGLMILTNLFLRMKEDGQEVDRDLQTVARAQIFCKKLGIDDDLYLSPTLYDFYC